MKQKGNKSFRLIDLLPANQDLSLGGGYGIPVKKGNTELLSTLNQALKEIRQDGVYDKIVGKYFANK